MQQKDDIMFPALTVTDIESYINDDGKLVYILTCEGRGVRMRYRKIFKSDDDANGIKIGSVINVYYSFAMEYREGSLI